MIERRWTILLPLAVAACHRPGPVTSGTGGDGLVIEDITVISPEREQPLAHADVVIRDGRIARIATERVRDAHARRIDGRGRFLIPGLIDSHVHLGQPTPLDDAAVDAHPELVAALRAQLPRTYLAFGFTTVVDLDLLPETRRWFEATPLHPRVFHCGRAVRIPGGYGARRVPADAMGAQLANLVHEPGQAAQWPAALDPRDFTPARAVDRVVAAGGICVKAFVEPGFGGAFHWPVPRPETLQALRDEAHRRGRVFLVHANGVDAWRAAIDARADVIAHGLWHWPGDPRDATPPAATRAVIAAAAAARIRVQPTAQAVHGDRSVFDDSILDEPRFADAVPRAVLDHLRGAPAQAGRRALADEYRGAIAELFGPAAPDPAAAMAIAPARATATLRRMVAERVRLVFGSDTPANVGIGNPPGLNGRLELARWLEAGVPPALILRAATLDNATAFGLEAELGSIEVGKRADLLVLGADPRAGVAAYDAIELVILNGQPIARDALLPVDRARRAP